MAITLQSLHDAALDAPSSSGQQTTASIYILQYHVRCWQKRSHWNDENTIFVFLHDQTVLVLCNLTCALGDCSDNILNVDVHRLHGESTVHWTCSLLVADCMSMQTDGLARSLVTSLGSNGGPLGQIHHWQIHALALYFHCRYLDFVPHLCDFWKYIIYQN